MHLCVSATPTPEVYPLPLPDALPSSPGLRVFTLDLVLYVLVTLAVVLSVQTIGNVLVLALLVTPAATARLLTDRLGVMMLLAPTIGSVSAVVGLYLSWSIDLPVGGTIVLVATGLFVIAWLASPRNGLIPKARPPRSDRSTSRPPAPRAAGAHDGAPA